MEKVGSSCEVQHIEQDDRKQNMVRARTNNEIRWVRHNNLGP